MSLPSFRLHASLPRMKCGAVVRVATATAYIRTTRSNISAHLAVKTHGSRGEEEGREKSPREWDASQTKSYLSPDLKQTVGRPQVYTALCSCCCRLFAVAVSPLAYCTCIPRASSLQTSRIAVLCCISTSLTCHAGLLE